jgi:hypothetical protein
VNQIIRTAGLALLLIIALAGTGAAGTQWYFKHAAWVCSTPDAYDQAIAAQRNLDGKTLDELRKELFDRKLCVFISDDEITGVMSPYITLLETRGDKMNVSFFIRYEKSLAFLHKEFTWYKFVGWTEAANLRELW